MFHTTIAWAGLEKPALSEPMRARHGAGTRAEEAGELGPPETGRRLRVGQARVSVTPAGSAVL